MPAIGFRIAPVPAFAFLLLFTNLTAAGIEGSHATPVATASNRNIAAPDQPGPFKVGAMVFSAAMSGGRTTRVQVFYPTAERGDCAMRYRIDFLAGFYELQSPLCARQNALALPGSFPLVVHDHGGFAPGADLQRVAQIPLHETMASHGFVTAVALHSGDAVVRVRDLTLVIDALLARSAASGDPLAGSIDPARIGISGISAGAAAAIGAAGGVEASGVPADPRIKAMVVYEPSLEYSLDDASRITIPYLIMGGSQSQFGLAVPALFAKTVEARPRIYVLNPSATHFSYVTGMCTEIDQTRDAAVLADPALPEPLTTRIATNPAAARAYDLWNMGQILFALLGPGTGGGRNFCNRVGVNSVRSLDAMPQDGFTDSPPFLATDAFTLNPVIPEEMLVPQIKLHTVAFWKTFLQGDHRYTRYLTAGYARRHHLQAAVFKIDQPERFATLRPTVEIQRPHRIGDDGGDRLEFDGEGTLGQGSDGVDPAADDVMFRVGSLTLKIPGGSFVEQVEHDEIDERREDGRKDASQSYSFRGVVDGIPVRAEIAIGDRGKFAFRLRALNANVGLIVNPVQVGFSIGGDFGESSARAEFDRDR
jgi:predicted dienelactone hydrolase